MLKQVVVFLVKKHNVYLMKSILQLIKNAIPFDTEKPFKASGIRIGTPAMTTKGFKEEDFEEVARIIAYRFKK